LNRHAVLSASNGERKAEAAARKLAAARARLMLERPFLGALVVHLPVVPSTHCRRIATDARAIHYEAEYIDGLSQAQAQAVLAHVALHCALNHFARRGSRLVRRWDVACDYAVNQLLLDDGLSLPPGFLVEPRFRGLSAEEIYPLLDDVASPAGEDEHWFSAFGELGGMRFERPQAHEYRPASEEFIESHRDGADELGMRVAMSQTALADEWEGLLAASADAALQSGRLNPHWRAVITDLGRPRLPWRALLARFLASLARNDYSFQKPSRRGGDALLPGMASAELTLVVALDTSGSIGAREFRQFIDEIDALKGQLSARVLLLLCDAKLAPGAPLRFEPWEHIALPEGIAGGGTTRFAPVFDWVAQQGARPDALLYFTDALGEFPPRAPVYPVLWLVKGNGTVPWGERVQLN
jgi:predicted metal-dependent peptidase